MSKYRINYSQVISQVQEISSLCDELQSQILQLQSVRNQTSRFWKSEASIVFDMKIGSIIDELTRTRNQMINLNKTIKYCADRIQKEDEEQAQKAAALASVLAGDINH